MSEHALRHAAILTPIDDVVCLRLSGDAFEVLDRVSTQALFMLDGQMKQSLFLDEAGRPIADVTIARDDDGFILFAEGMSAGALREHLAGAECEDLSESHAHLSVDGPFAWEVVAAVLGPEVIGVPYLSFYRARGVMCFRAGKTGEYGYDLLVPRDTLNTIDAELRERGAVLGLVDGSREVLARAAIENWFFDMTALAGWRGPALTPIELQLRWRLALQRDFVGAAALRAHTSTLRVTSFTAATMLAPNDPIRIGDERIGAVLAVAPSATRGDVTGWAVLDRSWAHAGIDRFVVDSATGTLPIKTRTPPLLANRSLFVDPHRHSARVPETYPALVPEVLR